MIGQAWSAHLYACFGTVMTGKLRRKQDGIAHISTQLEIVSQTTGTDENDEQRLAHVADIEHLGMRKRYRQGCFVPSFHVYEFSVYHRDEQLDTDRG